VHWDSGPALYFMGARYYAANIGRFITVDPVRGAPQDPLSLHRYLYAYSNPTVYVDLYGYEAERNWTWEGETKEEALKNIKEAIELYLEADTNELF